MVEEKKEVKKEKVAKPKKESKPKKEEEKEVDSTIEKEDIIVVKQDEKPIEVEWDIQPKKDNDQTIKEQTIVEKKKSPIKKPDNDDQMTLF